jgi:P-type Ca2+ transporter type 2C
LAGASRAGAAMGKAPWTWTEKEAAARLDVEPARGLCASDVATRRRKYGPNALHQKAQQAWWRILVEQFRSFLVGLLAVGAVLSLLLGEWLEAVAIVAVIAINAAIGFVVQLRAVRSMEALRTLGVRIATVRRDGIVTQVPAVDLVPGDVVLVEGGDVVSADLRITQASLLKVDESLLTGESLPVDKTIGPQPAETVLAERSCMLFKGTPISRGTGEALVVATGMETELGRISALVESVEETDTPLEKRLDHLGRVLGAWSLAFVALVTAIGIARGRDMVFMIEAAIALAVATVPEGLPIVATVALARGMWRMARRNALLDKPSAVEALGSVTVILTDKTGTLTENRMTVNHVEVPGASVTLSDPNWSTAQAPAAAAVRELLTTAALCTDVQLSAGRPTSSTVGDPMELALVDAAYCADVDMVDVAANQPEVRQVAFDAAVLMMATFHAGPMGLVVAVKGAPEAVLSCCDHVTPAGHPLSGSDAATWAHLATKLGDDGLRVLAIARRAASSVEEAPFAGLTLLGLVGLLDPPRRSAANAVGVFQRAGIRVVVATGDQPATAAHVARAVGIPVPAEGALRGAELPKLLASEQGRERVVDAAVVARMSPEQKLDLLSLYQERGHVTAMIGDGVNDAPALRKADIGVAMGKRGSQVAREAGDMVLLDDELGTIAMAIHQGRVIFGNLRRFVVYLLSCNVSEILCVGLAASLDAPLPILPLQILFLNLVTDVFPALALGVGEGGDGEMTHGPLRKSEAILGASQWRRIAGWSGLMAAGVLGAHAWASQVLGMDPEQAVTVSFAVLCLSQLLHVFNMTTPGAGVFVNDVTRNPWIWGAVVLCVGLLVAGVHLPGLSDVLGTTNPGASGWAVIVVVSAVPLAVGRTWSLARKLWSHR